MNFLEKNTHLKYLHIDESKPQQIASSNIPLAEDLNVIESQNGQGTPGYNPHDLAT